MREQLIPKMRSAVLAKNLRQLAWDIIRNNPDLSYSEVKHLSEYIEKNNRFIQRRSLKKNQIQLIKKDWRDLPEAEILKKYKISRTFLYKLINNQI